MELTKTLILGDEQISHRINRLAYQVYEDNADEKEIILAGIMKSGFKLAGMLKIVLEKIAPFRVTLVEVHINKHSQVESEIRLSENLNNFQGKVVILVDDVLNSGKTIIYALRPFLGADLKKIRTVVLIDRNHRRYPIAADFVGLSLATTLQEHVSVEFNGKESAVYLS